MTDQEKTPEQVAAEQAAEAARVAGQADPPEGQTPEEVQAELERTRTALKAANKEAADRRKKIDAYEKAEEERKTAELSEVDKLKAENDRLTKENEEAAKRAKSVLIRAAFVAEAAKAGAAYPEDVYRLADHAAVECDDEGTVTGVADAVKVLVEAGRVPMSGKPPAPDLNGGAGGGSRSHGAMKLTPEELEAARRFNITPEKYAENKAALAKRA